MCVDEGSKKLLERQLFSQRGKNIENGKTERRKQKVNNVYKQ